jgi:hypothetical protein
MPHEHDIPWPAIERLLSTRKKDTSKSLQQFEKSWLKSCMEFLDFETPIAHSGAAQYVTVKLLQ